MSRVFLPGFALNSAMYSRLDAAQSSDCIDILPKATWDETIDDLATIMKQQTLAIGYSLGGRLALGIALKFPALFSGLVLVSAHCGLLDAERADRIQQDELQAQETLKDSKKMFESFDQRDVFDTLDASTQNFLDDSRVDDEQVIAQQLRVLGLGTMPNYEERLNELRIPVLYISGVRDTKFCSLSTRYKKQTPFSHHRVVDSDHRIPFVAPRTLSLNIEWFAKNVI